MIRRLIRRPAPAALLALAVLVLAGGGTAAAAKLLTGKDVRNASLTGADLKDRSVGSADLGADVRRALARRGAAGPAGPAGPQGARGAPGPAGTPDGFTKTESDAAFVARAGRAADAARLDGGGVDELVAGDGALRGDAYVVPIGQGAKVDLGRLGAVQLVGEAGSSKRLFVATKDDAVVYDATTVGDAAPVNVLRGAVPAQEGGPNIGATVDNFTATLQIHRAPPTLGGDADFASVVVTATDDGGPCRFHVEAITSQHDTTTP